MNSTTRTIGAAFGLASIAAFSIALPASAATVSGWGVWYSTDDEGVYTVSFDDASMPDADVTVSNYESVDIYAPADEEEGFTADSPLGQVIGANDASTDYNFLKVETIDDNAECATVDITFDTAVPADQLVLAISDVDSDNATISMEDENGDPVDPSDIAGFGPDTEATFNWADLNNTDDVPSFSYIPGTPELILGDAPDNTDGSTGWVRPSVSITSAAIVICTEDGNYSSQRIWLGQVYGDSLANTGASDSLYLAAAAGGAMLAVGGLVGLRRRQA